MSGNSEIPGWQFISGLERYKLITPRGIRNTAIEIVMADNDFLIGPSSMLPINSQ
jgi:hypothetical protein